VVSSPKSPLWNPISPEHIQGTPQVGGRNTNRAFQYQIISAAALMLWSFKVDSHPVRRLFSSRYHFFLLNKGDPLLRWESLKLQLIVAGNDPFRCTSQGDHTFQRCNIGWPISWLKCPDRQHRFQVAV